MSGVDRKNVVGALDALVDGGERVVDLAEVNGRVFVNNVSLGVYAVAVQREGYRAAKLRTLLGTLPDVAGARASPPEFVWTGPHGTTYPTSTLLLISNNRYRLAGLSSGTRPRIDDGRLGIAVVPSRQERGGRRRRPRWPRRPWREWSAAELEVRSAAPVVAGIDGEAGLLDPPLRFRSLPGALRVRIAPAHPGASPSASQPDSIREGARTLWAIVAGRAR